jgi:hypothetical protein
MNTNYWDALCNIDCAIENPAKQILETKEASQNLKESQSTAVE